VREGIYGRLLPVAIPTGGRGGAPPRLRHHLRARDGCRRHATNGTVARYRTRGEKSGLVEPTACLGWRWRWQGEERRGERRGEMRWDGAATFEPRGRRRRDPAAELRTRASRCRPEAADGDAKVVFFRIFLLCSPSQRCGRVGVFVWFVWWISWVVGFGDGLCGAPSVFFSFQNIVQRKHLQCRSYTPCFI
jgi:hypothetical protein